ncbi:MAG: BolA family transcriptional regulator [Hyphomonas sp.]|nr:BolA family transcriptional regulator [Hyphomonas sp.]
MTRDTLEGFLTEAFPEAEIVLTDLAGDNDHWQAEIISEQFRGKTRVAQHQMVYAALKGKMGGELHALALKTRAPG